MSGVKEIVCTNCHVVVPLRKCCTHCGAILRGASSDKREMEKKLGDDDRRSPACIPAA